MENATEPSDWFAAVIESADDAILSKTLDGIVLTWNPAAERMYGWTAEDIVGRSVSVLLPPDRPDELADLLARIGQGERFDRLTTQRLTRDGRLIDVSLTLSPVHNAAGEVVGAATIGRDITRDLHLQQELVQAQKMESIGRLAGGIAHDFNNLLTVITGYGELAQAKSGRDVSEELEQIVRAGRRAAELTHRLLLFSRREAISPRIMNVNDVVEGLGPMLGRLIGEDVEISLLLDPRLRTVWSDPVEVEQLLLNLAVNARDAMPEGGRLTIETVNAVLDQDYTAAHEGVLPGRYVLLAVTDTGHGMDGETRARVFEPFFTTKEQGKGTGLGLSTVFGIVERAGGHIWFYSEPEQGAAFKIYLPEAAGVEPDAEAPGQTRATTGGDERILLVEDEQMVRQFACTVLRQAGYEITEVASPIEALQLWEDNERAFDLLVCDVILPGMSGPEFLSRLGTRAPATIFMSGYTGETIVQHGLLERSELFIHKPFTRQTLLATVRTALDHRP